MKLVHKRAKAPRTAAKKQVAPVVRPAEQPRVWSLLLPAAFSGKRN